MTERDNGHNRWRGRDGDFRGRETGAIGMESGEGQIGGMFAVALLHSHNIVSRFCGTFPAIKVLPMSTRGRGANEWRGASQFGDACATPKPSQKMSSGRANNNQEQLRTTVNVVNNANGTRNL
jgi:hypothetical protein